MKVLNTQGRLRERNNALSRSTVNNTGYKFLKYIEDNQGTTTQDNIKLSVLGHRTEGYFSALFSDLVYSGLCVATTREGYQITSKGVNKLREVESKGSIND